LGSTAFSIPISKRIAFAVGLAVMALTAVLVAGFVLATSIGAQTPPVGGPQAEVVHAQYTCGASLGVAMKAGIATNGFPGTAWVNIPEASVTLPVVAGNTDCIVVSFSTRGYAQEAVDPTVYCFVRAVSGGATMFPRGFFQQHAKSQGVSNWESATQQWIYRITPTTNSINVYVQWAANSSSEFCNFNGWTLVAERFQ
jgi:hypothetical protein